ncbi:unnamed protein product [Boreogadus saida]
MATIGETAERALEDGSEPRPPLSHHNLLINQLVGDYLEFNQYRYAASVLKAGPGSKVVTAVKGVSLPNRGPRLIG